MNTSWIVVLATVLAIGCSKPSASTAPPAPTNESGAVAPAGGSAGAPQVVCTLDCSGTEAKGYGATEEEARADVSKHVTENCKPEDGQYFIFCDPAKSPPSMP